MRFELQIVGLCVVIEASAEDDHHRIVAVDPAGVEGVPDHSVYLSFDDENLEQNALRGVDLEKHDTQWRARLPKRTTVRLPEAQGRALNLPAAEPATLEGLGLGRRVRAIGRGDWLDGEQGRALLPKANADADWTGTMGSWRFPALGGRRLQAACSFAWGGRFADRLRIEVDGRGQIVLKPSDRYPDDTVKLAYSCIQWPEVSGSPMPMPFGYCQAFHRVAEGSRADLRRPESESMLVHAGSASCPPVRG